MRVVWKPGVSKFLEQWDKRRMKVCVFPWEPVAERFLAAACNVGSFRMQTQDCGAPGQQREKSLLALCVLDGFGKMS